jgi:predicted Ser/Thr protein kinase
MISESALDRLRGLMQGESESPAVEAGASRYELLSILGRGGMGTVYLARDTALDREVALKVLDPAREADPTIAARLAQEARIIGRLEHPGIVPVHDFGRLADGRLFYAMKCVRGERLDRWMATVDLPARLSAFLRMCEAVSFAHAHGVIHRDLKPENVMIGPFGEVLVLDWGVARLLAPAPSAAAPVATTETGPAPAAPVVAAPPPLAPAVNTAHGTVVGTPAFMAPEQARGDIAAIDQRTDIYALGATLRAMAAPADSRALQAIAAKACAEKPADRYQSVKELSADVARFVGGLAVHARREPMLDRVKRLVWRYRTPLLLILTYLLARLLLFWAFRV